MSALRYVDKLQENAIWLLLSALWAVGGLLAWLSSMTDTNDWHGSSSGLAILGLFVAATTLTLRLPILTSPPRTSLGADHCVWLLTMFANINWLGFLAWHSRHGSDVYPMVLMLGAGEAWFHVRCWQMGALPWLRSGCQAIGRQMSSLGVAPHSKSPAAAIDAGTGPLRESDRDSSIVRQTVQGIDEHGRRYLSGEIVVTLAAEQTTESLSIAFSPPFSGEPDIDFECEGPEEVDVTTHLIHSSPAGMRLGLRRAASPQPLVFSLQWYAAEVELEDVPHAPGVLKTLP